MLSDQAHYSRPPQDRSRAVLYVAHHSSDAELRDEPLVAELIAQDRAAACYGTLTCRIVTGCWAARACGR